MGIRHCEARYNGCAVTNYLGFAHVLRRRHLGKDVDLREANMMDVALLCNNCHDYIDVVLGEDAGGQELRRIINNRKGEDFWKDERG